MTTNQESARDNRLVLRSIDDFRQRRGEALFRSAPTVIEQSQIQDYCRSIGQLDWFHFDEERAREEFGAIVAPGTMTLALIHPTYFREVELRGLRALFLGSDRFRIVGPLKAGDSIDLTFTVVDIAERDEGFAVYYDFEWRRNESPISLGNMIVRYWPTDE